MLHVVLLKSLVYVYCKHTRPYRHKVHGGQAYDLHFLLDIQIGFLLYFSPYLLTLIGWKSGLERSLSEGKGIS